MYARPTVHLALHGAGGIPFHRQEGVINTNDGGRGLNWLDPNGHSLEILTVPYGGWPA